MSIFKRLIAPLQQRVLAKRMCVACTRPLDKQKFREPLTLKTELVLCECGRAYVLVRDQNKYRRASNAEVRLVPGLVRN